MRPLVQHSSSINIHSSYCPTSSSTIFVSYSQLFVKIGCYSQPKRKKIEGWIHFYTFYFILLWPPLTHFYPLLLLPFNFRNLLLLKIHPMCPLSHLPCLLLQLLLNHQLTHTLSCQTLLKRLLSNTSSFLLLLLQ